MGRRILVVDDEAIVRRTVQRILEAQGMEVSTAEDGEDCLRKLDEGFRGLILMDIVMPGLDGWQTIEAMVRKGYTEGNIICMLTGKENPDEQMEKYKEYVLDYIRKPFKQEQLIAIVQDYLNYLE